MGYRSTVAYVIQFEDAEHKKEFIAVHKLDDRFKDAIEELNNTDEDGSYVSFYAEDIKWYPSYEDVAMHERLLDYINELSNTDSYEKSISARFIRIGEDTGDTQDEGYGDDPWDIGLWVARHVESEYSL